MKFEGVQDKIFWNFKELKSVPSTSIDETMKSIKERAFAVTGVYAADKVETIRQGLEMAMKEGWSLETFKTKIQEILQARGFSPLRDDNKTFRWDVIYRTNIKTAYERGRFDKMMGLADIFPYRRFVAVEDSRTTASCLELNGAVARYDSDMYLNNQCPRHFNCRSTWIIERNPVEAEIQKWEKVKIESKEGFGKFELPKEFEKKAAQKIKEVEKKIGKETDIGKKQEKKVDIYKIRWKKVWDATEVEKSKMCEYMGISREKGLHRKELKLDREMYFRLFEKAKALYSEEEVEFLTEYTGSSYIEVNGYLRSGGRMYRENKQMIQKFNRKDWKLKVDKDFWVARGEKYETFEEIERRIWELENGNLGDGFISTTVDDYTAKSFAGIGGLKGAIIMKLKVKKGSKVAIPTESLHEAEEEIILPSRTRIEVKKKQYDIRYGRLLIYIEGEVWTE